MQEGQYESSVPVILDRCHQARVRNALEPEWEARFEPRSYGQQAEQVRARLAEWLKPRGLAISEAKTRIVPLTEGFDFLAFNLRHYPNGKLIIKPGATAIKRFRDRLAKEFRALRGANVAAVLAKIVPITRGWVAYYRTVVSSRVFAALTDYLWKLTYKWACWSHPNKPKRWIVGRYFRKFNKVRNDRWVFGDKDTGAYLPKPAWTDIVRHTMVKSGASPDDPAQAGYWAQRRQKVKPPLDSYTVRLLSRQDGRCSLCGENLLTPTSHPSPPRAGNTGSCRSLGKRSRRTTWSATIRPAPRATREHTSYTPPATGANIRPGRRETPWCNRTPEPPQRLAWAACAGTCMRGPEGAPVQQCTGATRQIRCAVTEVHQEVADLLGRPRAVRIRGNAEDVYVAGADLDDEQAVKPAEGHCTIDVEEIGGEHRRGLGVQELPPGRVGCTASAPGDLQFLEDPPDRGGANPVAELEWPALDPLVSPGVVLGGEPPDQRCDLETDRWAARPVRVGPLPCSQSAMPAQDGARCHQPVCPKRSGQVADQRGQHRAVGPVQPWPRMGATQHGDLVP